MPRHRSSMSRSTVSMKCPSPSGLIQAAGVEMRRKAALRDQLRDLVSAIAVGPNAFPIKRSMGQALFGLAVDLFAKHDKTKAEALRRFAGQFARLEFLDFKTTPMGLSSGDASVATWLLSEELTYSAEELRDKFRTFSRAVGKQTCHPTTLRRQYKLLNAHVLAHNYPIGVRSLQNQRPTWVREHLLAMIAEAQMVSCWHSQPDLTEEDLETVLNEVDEQTSPSKLSALVVAHLHSISADSLRKRILSRRRQ